MNLKKSVTGVWRLAFALMLTFFASYVSADIGQQGLMADDSVANWHAIEGRVLQPNHISRHRNWRRAQLGLEQYCDLRVSVHADRGAVTLETIPARDCAVSSSEELNCRADWRFCKMERQYTHDGREYRRVLVIKPSGKYFSYRNEVSLLDNRQCKNTNEMFCALGEYLEYLPAQR